MLKPPVSLFRHLEELDSRHLYGGGVGSDGLRPTFENVRPARLMRPGRLCIRPELIFQSLQRMDVKVICLHIAEIGIWAEIKPRGK